MRTTRTGRLVASLLTLLLLAPAAARAEQDETGPNFTLPETVKPEIKERYEEAVKAFEEAHEARKDQTAKTEAAVKKLLAVRREAPELPQVGYYLGIAYQITKEFEKARQVLQAAVEANPKFHQALVELGDVYVWLKQPEKAATWYDKAIAVAPTYAHAFLMRGLLRLRRSDIKGSVADLEKAKALGAKDEWLPAMLDLANRAGAPPWPGTIYEKESANYIVRTPVSQEIADEMSLHVEAINETYASVFPKIKKEKRKFEVFVYASKEDYHANGGPPSAAGHYDPMLRRLHVYTHADMKDTTLTLYHEGFHQFLHDYLEDAPQWFNEGLGDFFGPTEYMPRKDKKGKVTGFSMRLRPNPWRLDLIQAAIERGRVRSWRQLMLMSQAELYDEEWAGIHYAQSWSIIYFLIRGGARPDQTVGPYFELLKSYFAALRKGDGQGEAFEKTFGKQDLVKLEAEWRRFILRLGPEG